MKTKLYKALLSFLLVLALAFAVVGLVLAREPVTEQSTSLYEIDFMQNMVEQHIMAVMQAETCIQNAKHSELRKFCEDFITTQNQEMMLMQFWIYNWHKVNFEPKMALPNARYLTLLADKEFEIELMETVMKHQNSVITESKRCIANAAHSDLVDLCSNMFTTQTQNINTLQNWQCEWYGICKNQYHEEEDLFSAR